MVCKDDMFAWFKHLSGSGRIEVVHGLLNMCMPFELRFAGTCVEFLARKDFRYLKEHELKANSAVETSKLRLADWVQDPIARHKMTVCLALLGSANTAASKFVFDALTLNETQQSLAEKLCAGDASARSEVLLMFTLALCHPAFTFAQKEEIAVRLKVVQSITDRLDGKIQDQHQGGGRKCEAEEANGGGGSGGFGGGSEGPSGGPGYVGASGGNTYSNSNGSSHGGNNLMNAGLKGVTTMCLEDTVREGVSGSVPLEPADTTAPGLVAALSGPNRAPSTYPKIGPLPSQQTAQTGKSHIKNLELKKMPKQKKDKRVEYKIQVTWSGGEVTDVIKSQQELCNFHQQLVHSFAEDGASHRQERSIPYFPGPRPSRGETPAEEGMSRMVVDYLRQLMTKVPPNMLDSELVTSFFKGQLSPAKVPNGPVLIGNQSSSPSSSSLNVSTSAVATSEVSTLDDRVAKDGVGGEGRVKTLTVYNSHLPGDAPTTRSANDCGRWKASGPAVAPVAGASSPTNFVHRTRPSPTSSPSPAQLAPGSYSVQENSILDRFGKEGDRKDLEPSFRSLSVEEALNRDDLEKMNPKPTRMLEKVKPSCPNGLVTHLDERVISPHLHGSRRFPSADWSQPPSDGIVYACQPQQVYMPNNTLDFVVQYSTQQRQGYGVQVHSDSSEYSSPAASPALDRPGSRSDSDDNVETTEPEDGRGLRNQTVHPAHNVSNLQQHPPRHQHQQQQQQQQHGYQKVKTYPAGAMLENANVALVHPQQLRGKGLIRGRSNSNSTDTGRKVANRPQTLGPLPLSQGPRVEPVAVEMGALYTGPATLTYPAVGYVSTQQGQVRSPAATPPPPQQQTVTSAALCTSCTCSCTTTTSHLTFSPSFIPFHMGGAASVTTMFTGYTPALHGPSQPQPTHVPPPPANGYLHTGIHNFAYPPPQGMPPGMTPDMMYTPAQFQPPGVMQQQMGLAGSPSNGAGAGAPQVPGFLTGPTPNVGFHGPVGAYPQVNAHTQRAFGEHFVAKKPSCYNCGLSGHFGGECLEVTMEEVTNQGQYRLNLHQDPSELGEEN